MDMITARSLWAMHPDFLAVLLTQGTIETILPEALKSLGLALSVAPKAKAADPIREGATVILPVDGPLSPRGSWGGTSTTALSNRLREFGADSKIGAIVLSMSTPGGLVWGSQECGDAIIEVRESKPVVAVASPYCFSAGHWLACSASAYYASPSAQVGSVGVRGGHVDQSGFEDKIGFKTTLIASHPDKVAGHPFAPLSDEDRAEMQTEIDEMFQEFVAAIARGRRIKASEVTGIHGTGKIFSAKRAAELGITDGVMTLRDVVAKYGSSRSRLDLMRRQAALLEQSASI